MELTILMGSLVQLDNKFIFTGNELACWPASLIKSTVVKFIHATLLGMNRKGLLKSKVNYFITTKSRDNGRILLGISWISFL